MPCDCGKEHESPVSVVVPVPFKIERCSDSGWVISVDESFKSDALEAWFRNASISGPLAVEFAKQIIRQTAKVVNANKVFCK